MSAKAKEERTEREPNAWRARARDRLTLVRVHCCATDNEPCANARQATPFLTLERSKPLCKRSSVQSASSLLFV